jgi:hypothetical protein
MTTIEAGHGTIAVLEATIVVAARAFKYQLRINKQRCETIHFIKSGSSAVLAWIKVRGHTSSGC